MLRSVKSERLPDGNRLILLSVLPFPMAVLGTFLLIATIGNRFPRNLAPGSSLALHGLILSLLVMGAVTLHVRRRWHERRVRRFSLLLCAITSVMAWPVWTVGVLPSVNGLDHDVPLVTPMQLKSLTTSHASKSRTIYHWAFLERAEGTAVIGEGRYFVAQPVFERWQGRVGRTVAVSHASGLLGARIILDYQ